MTTPPNAFRVQKVAAPLRQTVTENIRNAISTGHFEAGSHLPERELCEVLGVSRTLVREALRQLETEGWITVIPHRGPFVTKVTREQAEGIYKVRIELEGLACELFATNATDAQCDALKEAFAAFRDLPPSTDRLAQLQAKNRFYECLLDGAQNETLNACMTLLDSRVMLLRATSLQAPGRAEDSVRELADLVDKLIARDAPAARKAAQDHIRMAGKTALSMMDEEVA